MYLNKSTKKAIPYQFFSLIKKPYVLSQRSRDIYKWFSLQFFPYKYECKLPSLTITILYDKNTTGDLV